MQSVIELGRVIRERKGRPLKQPLRRLTVVHPNREVLGALEGELSEYIYQVMLLLGSTSLHRPVPWV